MENNTENYSIFQKDLIAMLNHIGEKSDTKKTNELIKLMINNKTVYNKDKGESISSQLLINWLSQLMIKKRIILRKTFLLFLEDNLKYYIDELNASDRTEFTKQESQLTELMSFISYEKEFIINRDGLTTYTDNENIFLESENNYSTFDYDFHDIQEFINGIKNDIIKLDYFYWLQKEYKRLVNGDSAKRENLVPLINYVERNISRINNQLNSPASYSLYVNESENRLKMYMASKIHHALKRAGIKFDSELFAKSLGYELNNSFKTAYTTTVQNTDEKWRNFIKIISS